MYANLGIDHVYNWHDGHGNVSPRVVRYTLHFEYNEKIETLKLVAVTNEFGFSVKKGSECWDRYACMRFQLFGKVDRAGKLSIDHINAS